jgi:hypothetical protein
MTESSSPGQIALIAARDGSRRPSTKEGRGDMRRTPVLTALAVAAGLGVPATAAAEERTCRGTIGAVTVDNLRVPQQATCRLQGTIVQGTIKVEHAARLVASAVRVIGNVQAEGAASVTVASSRVGGSVQVVQGRDSRLDRNAVNGDVQYFENRGRISITANRIDGNLQCKENRPAPTGGGNIVQGNKEDQCARL